MGRTMLCIKYIFTIYDLQHYPSLSKFILVVCWFRFKFFIIITIDLEKDERKRVSTRERGHW